MAKDPHKKTELLSPAGNMECLKAAINAGADAVYLAGQRFGARASADNFTNIELIEALDHAHTYNRKIYLTLNTLIKEREWHEIYPFLKPLYEEGLDGIIVQDIGLIGYLKDCFPELPIHASTQMTVTHGQSARLLKELGVCRVVAARELSFDEICAIREETGLEMEVFIHGAMCYSYSGACLFSSFLGGRSGNRGRCAGPCRLPYNKDKYPLSMRDMCLIDQIPELVDAGIESFKIEGRLKSPEYVTGVTRIYRRAIDDHLDGDRSEEGYNDKDELSTLYLRGGRSVSYLHTHNSREMITLDDPSYNGPSNDKISELKEWSNSRDIRQKIQGNACFHVKQPMSLTLNYDNDVIVTVTGDVVEAATGRPATKEETEARLRKLGGTAYVLDIMTLDMDDDCFLPVGMLNDLRRRAVEKLNEERLNRLKRTVATADHIHKDNVTTDICVSRSSLPRRSVTGCPDISVIDPDQFKAVMSYDTGNIRVYLPYDLIYKGSIGRDELEKICEINNDKELLLSLPRIYRRRSDEYMSAFLKDINDPLFVKNCNIGGVLVKNLEELKTLSGKTSLKIITDHSIYVWNRSALKQMLRLADEVTLPLELNLHETEDELDPEYVNRLNLVIYGRAPLMVSANCVMKTFDKCTGRYDRIMNSLTDRYGKQEPVYVNCQHCFNEIYNALPTSYHKRSDRIDKYGLGGLRADLTDESPEIINALLDYYTGRNGRVFPVADHTTGHMDKGTD